MVYTNVLRNEVSDPNYENATFRARHGYKEEHAHDAPYRRNRDFKPVPYGSFKGILNYKHSEPFCLLKNMKDIPNEEHHILIAWGKAALKGGVVGAAFGYLYFVGGNTGPFEMNKLMAATGNRNWSGNSYRLLKNVLGRYAGLGAGLSLSYTWINFWLRHHDEANSRPKYLDHTIATTAISVVASAFAFKHPQHIFATGVFAILLISPITWYAYKTMKLGPGGKAANIFYENGTTKEEIERFRHQDMIENLGFVLRSEPGFGYHN